MRRLLAARALGWQSISALLKHASDADMATLSIAENLSRQVLSEDEISMSLEQARRIISSQELLPESFGISHSELNQFLNKNDSSEIHRSLLFDLAVDSLAGNVNKIIERNRVKDDSKGVHCVASLLCGEFQEHRPFLRDMLEHLGAWKHWPEVSTRGAVEVRLEFVSFFKEHAHILAAYGTEWPGDVALNRLADKIGAIIVFNQPRSMDFDIYDDCYAGVLTLHDAFEMMSEELNPSKAEMLAKVSLRIARNEYPNFISSDCFDQVIDLLRVFFKARGKVA